MSPNSLDCDKPFLNRTRELRMPYVPYALIGRRDLSNHFFHGMKSAVSASHTLTLQQHLHVGNCEDENENARFAEIEKEIIMKEVILLILSVHKPLGLQTLGLIDCSTVDFGRSARLPCD